MPDYEIRYYHADGNLAVVQMTVQQSETLAREHALHHQREHARFDVRLHGSRQQR
jgi:hypothetical protein